MYFQQRYQNNNYEAKQGLQIKTNECNEINLDRKYTIINMFYNIL